MNAATKDSAPQATSFWIAFGWLTHAVFVVLVYYVFWFFKGPDTAPTGGSAVDGLVDAALALQFTVSHSWLLLPATRERLSRIVPSPAYGVFFTFCTTVSLALMMACWRPWGGAWELSGVARYVVQGAFYGAWIALFYSVSLSGAGYQTGWTPWRPWSQGRPVPTREFRPRGVYRLMRHPLYLSFLGLVWFTPCMSLDRAVLTGVFTIYIFFGSYLKDRRLLFYLGDRYRSYQAEVPGYPGMLFGPLARVPWEPVSSPSSTPPTTSTAAVA
jgi:protein-S-isoprenylcysteine O-methyltransferase Ste14